MFDYDNLESVIDEELDNEVNMTEINSNWEADRLVGMIKKNREEAKTLTERAKEIINNHKFKVELWRDKQLETLENKNKYMLKMLSDYYMKVTDGQEKLKLPNGNVGFYAIREKVEWEDEKALISFIEEESKKNPSMNNLLRFDPKLNKDLIKSSIKFNTEGKAMLGNLILPHISHIEKHTEINVK